MVILYSKIQDRKELEFLLPKLSCQTPSGRAGEKKTITLNYSAYCRLYFRLYDVLSLLVIKTFRGAQT